MAERRRLQDLRIDKNKWSVAKTPAALRWDTGKEQVAGYNEVKLKNINKSNSW